MVPTAKVTPTGERSPDYCINSYIVSNSGVQLRMRQSVACAPHWVAAQGGHETESLAQIHVLYRYYITFGRLNAGQDLEQARSESTGRTEAEGYGQGGRIAEDTSHLQPPS
jgi:hypothetical protein